jgi:osmotically-inducible protein OsmY
MEVQSSAVDSVLVLTIAELAASRLRSNSYSSLKHVSCSFEQGWLILRGLVPNYYLKQLAQHAVAGLEGVQTGLIHAK